MIGDVKMQTIKQRTGRSLTGDRPLFLALCTTKSFFLCCFFCDIIFTYFLLTDDDCWAVVETFLNFDFSKMLNKMKLYIFIVNWIAQSNIILTIKPVIIFLVTGRTFLFWKIWDFLKQPRGIGFLLIQRFLLSSAFFPLYLSN